MTFRMHRTRWCVAVLVIALPCVVSAQRGGMGRGGGQHRGSSGGMRELDSSVAIAARDSVSSRVGFAGFALMHRSNLALTDSQTVALSSIDSVFHAVVDMTQPQLDTLRAANAALVQRMSNGAVGDTLTTAERDSVIVRRKAMSRLVVALRTSEQDTQTRASAVLTSTQRDEIAKLLDSVGRPAPRRAEPRQ